MFKWKKWVGTVLVGVSLVTIPVGALAASVTQTILYGAATMVILKQALSKMDDGQQSQMLANTQSKTGVVKDKEYSQRLTDIRDTLVKTGKVKRHYDVYANPSKDMNAFETIGGVISFNQGIMDAMDDSELAFVMSHEMTHGEKRHAVNGALKSVAVATVVDVALNGHANALDVLAGSLAVNYIDNEMVTMDQEKEADANGFEIFKRTNYNIGAAPSSMVMVYEKYGDLYTEGWNRVISPNNHPQMSSRIQKLGERVSKWSGNHVQVGGATVYVNGQAVVTPAVSGNYSSRRRAYLVAGNLARLCHDVYGETKEDDEVIATPLKKKVSQPAWQVAQEGDAINVNGTRVMSCVAGDDGVAITKNLGTALEAKSAMLSESRISDLNEQWLKVHGFKDTKKDTKKDAKQDTKQGTDQPQNQTK